jgi:hypothetical protein
MIYNSTTDRPLRTLPSATWPLVLQLSAYAASHSLSPSTSKWMSDLHVIPIDVDLWPSVVYCRQLGLLDCCLATYRFIIDRLATSISRHNAHERAQQLITMVNDAWARCQRDTAIMFAAAHHMIEEINNWPQLWEIAFASTNVASRDVLAQQILTHYAPQMKWSIDDVGACIMVYSPSLLC